MKEKDQLLLKENKGPQKSVGAILKAGVAVPVPYEELKKQGRVSPGQYQLLSNGSQQNPGVLLSARDQFSAAPAEIKIKPWAVLSAP